MTHKEINEPNIKLLESGDKSTETGFITIFHMFENWNSPTLLVRMSNESNECTSFGN